MKNFSNKKINILAAVLLIFFVILFSFGDLFTTKKASAAWYSSGGTWGYRKQITVDPEKVSGSSNLTDFPMLFKVTDLDLKHTAHGGKMGKIDATDLLFTSSDGSTKLSHEIEYYASTTGEIIAWVKVPTLYTAQETVIYVYFGNSGSSDQQDRTNVWDSNYKSVWHMANGTTLSGSDSTSNSNNLSFGPSTVGSTGVTPTATSTKIDGGAYFDVINQYRGGVATSTSALGLSTGARTVSGWFNPKQFLGTDTNSAFLVWQASGGNDSFGIFYNDAGVLKFQISNTVAVSGQIGNTTLSANTWYYITATWNGSNAYLYVNGTQDSTIAMSGSLADSRANLGYFTGSSRAPNVYMDDVRYSNIARSPDWILTEYYNQYSPESFYSYGAVGVENRSAAGVSTKGVAPVSGSSVKVRGGVKFR